LREFDTQLLIFISSPALFKRKWCVFQILTRGKRKKMIPGIFGLFASYIS